MAPRVTVFIDYQNTHFSAHGLWCASGEPKHLCLIHPLRLAETLVAMRPQDGELTEVLVFRGRPNPRHEPTMAAYSDRQAAGWSRDTRVTVRRRALRYPPDYGREGCRDRPQEKGVDVELAVSLVASAIKEDWDVAILVSHDTDLLPAIDAAAEVGKRVEVAAWSGSHRLKAPSIAYCHMLSREDFIAMRDHHDYEVKRRQRGLTDPASLMGPTTTSEHPLR